MRLIPWSFSWHITHGMLWSIFMTRTESTNYLNTISFIMNESSSMSWKRQCPVPKTLKCFVSHSQSLFCINRLSMSCDHCANSWSLPTHSHENHTYIAHITVITIILVPHECHVPLIANIPRFGDICCSIQICFWLKFHEIDIDIK